MALNHIVNGSPVEVKHIDYGTSVGYTKVGSPMISYDGIVSGFSSSNYLNTSASFNPSNKPFEISFKLSYITYNGYQVFLSSAYSVLIGFNSNKLYWALGQGSSWNIVNIQTYDSYSFVNGDTYYIKLSFNGSEYTLSYSTDGINYTTALTKTSSSNVSSSILQLGVGRDLTAAFKGSIDLNETYIKANGAMWLYKPTLNYLVKDNKLVFADSGLYLSGPVNYTVTGSPTIVDGVGSGWSADDYVRTDSTCDQRNITELVVKIKVPSSFMNTNTWRGILSQNFSLSLYSSSANNFIVNLNVNGMSTLAFSNLLPDVWCWLKYTNDGTTGRSYYSYDGVNYTRVSNADSTGISQQVLTTVSFGLRWGSMPFPGSIDFNDTYIKVNDSLWFYGKNYASQNIAPVPSGYTYGTTTTSAIGWVDMRTQQFTAAPAGATLGKD